jgi:SAM-dependent methyltransferase
VGEINEQYTLADHEFRDDDAYAMGKYRLAARWLHELGTTGVLYNVGCGAGQFNYLAVELGYKVHAFEPDAAAYALAVANKPPRCEVEQLGLEVIPGRAVADVVVMHDVLEHIEDDNDAGERLAQLIKPSGALLLSVPALPSLFGYHDEQLGHFRRYTRRSLQMALAPSFRVERLRWYGMTMVPVTLWYSRWRRRSYPMAGVSERRMTARAFDAICKIEERTPVPIGTSLLCLARPQARNG